jgi:hypothetical protein
VEHLGGLYEQAHKETQMVHYEHKAVHVCDRQYAVHPAYEVKLCDGLHKQE